MEKIAASIAQIAAEAVLKAQAEARSPLVLPPPLTASVVAWIAAQPEPKPTVQQAIERAVTEWLSAQGFPTARS